MHQDRNTRVFRLEASARRLVILQSCWLIGGHIAPNGHEMVAEEARYKTTGVILTWTDSADCTVKCIELGDVSGRLCC